MRKFYIYQMKASGTLKAHLAKGSAEITRVDTLLNDTKTYHTIFTSSNMGTLSDVFYMFEALLNAINAPVKFVIDKISSENTLCLNLVLRNSMFVDSCILNMSNEFWAIIEDVLTTFEFKFSYNNTRSCIFIRKGE